MTQPITYLSVRGYAFVKSENQDFVEELKERLTVKPYINPNSLNADKISSFSVYCESSNKFYIPRSYGLKHFGLPIVDQLHDGDIAPGLVFHGSLRPEQEAPVQSFLEASVDPLRRGGIISLSCGGGKCLGKDTPILMFDGTIRMVQDIQIGDVLMGDDSSPRTVLSTCIGQEEMFDIIPTKGDKYTVNRSHILSLKYSINGNKQILKDDVIDISVNDYLKTYHMMDGMLYGYRTGVDFQEKTVPFDPYLVGYWLGKRTYFMRFLRYFQLFGDKSIPNIYKCNSRTIRLQVLAGIIDTCGYLHKGGFDITLKYEKLIDDLIYIARSLGFAAYKSICHKTYRTNIRGEAINDIPTKIYKKKDPSCKQMKDVLITRIKPISIGLGRYYGFEIDGNRRFLLGDFTVTHNTVCSLDIACKLGKKTLVVCHKEFLINQWRERISQFIPTARVGIIKQSKVITEDCDIVLASLQSLAMRDYPSSIFKGFHLAIIDEIHHTSAHVFSRALPKISFPVMLGLSATLKRSDGLSKVFEWYVGKPVFVSKRKDKTVRVYMLAYDDSCSEYCSEIKMWGGRINIARMINNITEFAPRNRYILDALKFVLQPEPDRKTLILSDRRSHLTELEYLIKKENIGTVGYYVGGMKEKDLKESEGKDIILGTFTMACIADNTIMVDPISGEERYIREFADNVGFNSDGQKKKPIPLISMYPSTQTVHMSHCANFGYSPHKPCVTIIHELGDITLSKDHKVYTLDGWKTAGNLTISDYLIAPQKLDIKSNDIDHVNNADLWFIGCMIGELNSNSFVEEELHAMGRKIIDKSPVASKMWMYYRMQHKENVEGFIDTDLMFLPEEKLCSLIGGLFDGAGCTEKNHIYFVIKSMRLANQLRTLLLRLEIRTTRTPYVKPGFPYYVYIAPEDTLRFIRLVDVRGPSKKEFLKSIFVNTHMMINNIEKHKNPPTTSKWLSSVKIYSIFEVDSSSVRLCDIEVKIHHNFVASGIIVHNSEGMDIPALNTLILASPVSSIEQSIGRIQRQKAAERTYIPTVIDIWDQFSIFKTQGFRRQQFYQKNGYDIIRKLVRDQECMTEDTCSSISDSDDKKKTIEFIDDE